MVEVQALIVAGVDVNHQNVRKISMHSMNVVVGLDGRGRPCVFAVV